MSGSSSASFARRIRITLHDVEGRIASGAEVHVRLNGLAAGILRPDDGRGEGWIEAPARGDIDLEARFNGETQQVRLPPQASSHDFRFRTAAIFKAFRPPLAQCPDGSSGVPCVTCRIGTDQIRICI